MSAENTAQSKEGIVKPTVLLVEDSKVQRLANEKILLAGGYLVLVAPSGEEALRLAKEAKPDLMLLDLVLPKLSGLEVLQALKRDGELAMTPVIVLSNLTSQNKAEIETAGAAGYFRKSRLAEGATGEAELIALINKTLSETTNKELKPRTTMGSASR